MAKKFLLRRRQVLRISHSSLRISLDGEMKKLYSMSSEQSFLMRDDAAVLGPPTRLPLSFVLAVPSAPSAGIRWGNTFLATARSSVSISSSSSSPPQESMRKDLKMLGCTCGHSTKKRKEGRPEVTMLKSDDRRRQAFRDDISVPRFPVDFVQSTDLLTCEKATLGR